MTKEKTLARRDTGVITQSQAIYLLKTIWKDAPETEVIKAAILCRQYNLNPLMRQVYLVKFGTEWVTILGIKATRQIAQQALIKRGIRYSYQDGPRVMTEKEQVKIRGKVEPDKIWAVTIIQDSFGNTFPGYGSWLTNKQPYGSDKGNDAFNMAFIRSERNALDKLAPGELPDIETGDEGYAVGDFKAALNEGKQQIIADADQDIEELWGNGKAPEATTSTPSDGIKQGIEKQSGSRAPEAKSERDQATLITIGDLRKALLDDFGIKAQDQLAELNLNDWTELSITPAEAYTRILAVRTIAK